MTVKILTEFAVVSCAHCGIDFAVTKGFEDRLRDSHQSFYCPQGHSQYYAQKTDEDKLRDRLLVAQNEAYDERLARRKAEAKLDGALDRITKLKKRADAGLCPHCRRHFVNIERHIESKHKGGR